MPAIGECPDVQHLRELLLGRIAQPEADDLEHHLSSCNRCVQTVAKLSADDTLVEAVRHARCPVVEESDPILHDLMDRLKHREASPANSAVGTTTVPQAAELSSAATAHPLWGHERGQATERLFDFLAPARGGGEIGWLGHYRVLALLGSGGMGVVFQAEDSQLKRFVALKVMKSSLMVSDQQRQRFMREAQMTALIEHDHIVTIYQVGEDRGVLFLAMQMLKGETLEDRARRLGKLPVLEVLRIGRELARGLAAAHDRGLVHRDIKPGNIWLEADTDRVKVLDFGLARNAEDIHLSEQGVILGTPAYMAPEQARGETVGPASDLFSVGAVLYRLCTGEMPFRGVNTMAVLMAIGLDEPAAPATVNPDVPAVLSDLIMRLLAKQPGDRPASAGEVETSLATIERDLTAPPARPGRRLAWIAAAVVFIGVIGLAAFWFGSKVLRPAPEAAPTEGVLVLANDDADLQVVVLHGDTEVRKLDLDGSQSLNLAGGDYQLRLAEPRPGLQLIPEHVTVVPGEKRSFAVRRVGQLQSLEKLGAAINAVAFSPRGDRGLAAAEHSVLLLDLAKGTEAAAWSGHRSNVQCVAFSVDGRFALSGSGGKDGKPDFSVRLWDVATGQQIRPFRGGHTSWVTGIAFAADGKRAVSGGWDNTAIIWKVENGQAVRRLEGHDSGINSVAISADGRRVLTGSSDNTVRLWDADAGTELTRLEGHTDSVRSVALSPDGRCAISGSYDHTIRLWDLETGEEVRRFEGHEGWVNSVAFTRDGQRLLSGSADRTVRLWDVATGKEMCRFDGHTAAVQSVALSADGRRALSGGLDHTVRLWQLP